MSNRPETLRLRKFWDVRRRVIAINLYLHTCLLEESVNPGRFLDEDGLERLGGELFGNSRIKPRYLDFGATILRFLLVCVGEWEIPMRTLLPSVDVDINSKFFFSGVG